MAPRIAPKARRPRVKVAQVEYTNTMNKRRLTQQQARRVQAHRRADQAATPSEPDHQIGTVIARYGKQALVEGAAGERTLCHLRAHLDAPVAGDAVFWSPSAEAGVINVILERSNTVQRPDAQGRLRPVAANIDLMLIVFAPEPAPHPNLLDRYLVAAETAGIDAALVLNKSDLLKDSSLEALLREYEALGYPTLITRRDMPDDSALRILIGTKSLVLVGQSGVGKSSLIQRLLPDRDIRIGALSEAADKGRHTTTTAELFHLPGGGKLIDSPGVREFGLHHIAAEEVATGFREFAPFLGQCQFRDCRHQSEPNCALQAARDRGEIGSGRFASYEQIIASLN